MTKLPEWLDDKCTKAFSEMSGQYQEPVFAFMFINGFEAACEVFMEREKVMREALEFYAEAKVLFISKDGNMPKVSDPSQGMYHMIDSIVVSGPTHIKDDGNKAREALAKLKELED